MNDMNSKNSKSNNKKRRIHFLKFLYTGVGVLLILSFIPLNTSTNSSNCQGFDPIGLLVGALCRSSEQIETKSSGRGLPFNALTVKNETTTNGVSVSSSKLIVWHNLVQDIVFTVVLSTVLVSLAYLLYSLLRKHFSN